jgi:hypothetical protein
MEKHFGPVSFDDGMATWVLCVTETIAEIDPTTIFIAFPEFDSLVRN